MKNKFYLLLLLFLMTSVKFLPQQISVDDFQNIVQKELNLEDVPIYIHTIKHFDVNVSVTSTDETYNIYIKDIKDTRFMFECIAVGLVRVSQVHNEGMTFDNVYNFSWEYKQFVNYDLKWEKEAQERAKFLVNKFLNKKL